VISSAHRAEVAAMVEELERGGQAVTLVCLDRSHHEHGSTLSDVMHVPLLSPTIVSSVVHRPWALRPMLHRYAAVAVHLARVLPGRGIAEVRGVDRMAKKIASMVKVTPPDLSSLPFESLGAERVGVRWIASRINSTAAEASLDGERRVIVKRQDAAPAGHEYQMLRAIAAVVHGVPRVLLFDGQSIVMERASGATLEELARERAPHLEAGIRAAGVWLAAMQVATPRPGDRDAIVAEVTEEAIEDAARLARVERVFARNQTRIVDALQLLQKSVTPFTVCGHHGDYFPGNVFFDGERVTVIDFEGFRDGHPLEDAAYFALRTEMLRRRFRLSPALVERFFEGYGQDVDDAALRLFTMSKGMRTLANGLGYDQPLPQRIWARRTITTAVLDAAG
jgi:hypothetical protein